MGDGTSLDSPPPPLRGPDDSQFSRLVSVRFRGNNGPPLVTTLRRIVASSPLPLPPPLPTTPWSATKTIPAWDGKGRPELTTEASAVRRRCPRKCNEGDVVSSRLYTVYLRFRGVVHQSELVREGEVLRIGDKYRHGPRVCSRGAGRETHKKVRTPFGVTCRGNWVDDGEARTGAGSTRPDDMRPRGCHDTIFGFALLSSRQRPFLVRRRRAIRVRRCSTHTTR